MSVVAPNTVMPAVAPMMVSTRVPSMQTASSDNNLPAPLFTPMQAPAMQRHGVTQRSLVEEHFIHRKADYGTLRTPETNERVWVTETGQMLAQPLNQSNGAKRYVPIGQLWANGVFRLWDGTVQSIFNSPLLSLSTSNLFGPLGEALKLQAKKLGLASNETPYIRQNLTNRGLDGRGVTIYCLEFLERDPKTGDAQPADHLKLITSTLGDPEQGYVPGANLQMMLYQAPKDTEITDDDTPQSLIRKIVEGTVKGTDKLTERIQWIADNAQGPSIVSFSVGTSPYEDALFLNHKLEERDPETGQYTLPKLRERLYGPNHAHLSTRVKIEQLTHWLTAVHEVNPDIQAAFARYAQACDTAAQRGIPVNIAMGNDHTALPLGTRVPLKAMFNWYAMPQSVVRVAASDNNATPGNYADDTVATFSTRGDNGAFAPTVAATGVRVFIDRYFAYNHSGDWSGTSVATPIIAATQAMMLQANPNLSVAQLKQLLQQAATRNQTTVAETGAGIVDPVKAVNAALQTR